MSARILYPAVFITGAASLVLEVLSLRVFAPHFGTTLVMTSSVIGVVLGALSVGYVIGGRLADRRPATRMFWLLVALSGIAVTVNVAFAPFFLPLLSVLDIRIGAILASVLFLAPATVLLGMLSPYVIRLRARDTASVGTISGEVFFFSTTGSIVGTLLAGFVFVPLFPVSRVLLSLGVILTVIGCAGLWRSPKLFFMLLLGLAVSASVALASASVPRTESTRAITESPYAQLRVEELSIEGRMARTLVSERIFSGGFFLDTGEPAFPYSREIVDVISAFPVAPENILVIGAGPYTIPQELIRRYPEAKMTVVDIDPALLSLGKEWFGVDTNRILNVVEDGRRFFRTTDERFDVIVLDAYAALYSIPAHLTTREFFSLVEEDTAPDGFVAMNTIAALPEAAVLLGSVVKTFSEAFPEATVLPVGEKGAHELRNFLIASRAPAPEWQPAENFMGAGFVLTDDYAPLDTLLTPLLRLAAQQ